MLDGTESLSDSSAHAAIITASPFPNLHFISYPTDRLIEETEVWGNTELVWQLEECRVPVCNFEVLIHIFK